MYNWDLTGEKGRKAFVRKVFRSITSAFPGEGFNYIHVQSITNMGLLDSELVLTASPFNGSKKPIKYLLPPSPRGVGCWSLEG